MPKVRRRLLLSFDGDESLDAFVRELHNAQIIPKTIRAEKCGRAHELVRDDGHTIMFTPPPEAKVIPFRRPRRW